METSSRHLRWVYYAMRQRCANPSNPSYKNYGGRGISICDEWSQFEEFSRWANRNGYRRGLQIDRKNNDGDYSPDNCEFVTRTQNLSHTRHNVLVTAFGETKHAKAWSRDERCNCSYRRLMKRLFDLGWQPEDAITRPARKYRMPISRVTFVAFGERKTAKQWFNDQRCVCHNWQTFTHRLRKWNTEEAITTPVKT